MEQVDFNCLIKKLTPRACLPYNRRSAEALGTHSG